MSDKHDVVIAFSGGLESTYLAQLMLEKGHDVQLCYSNIVGKKPCFLEAALVYRCYEKIKGLFPDRKVVLTYMDKGFFGTHHSNNAILHVNQAMRVACLLTELQKMNKHSLFMCGWTGEGTQENCLNPGAYSEQQYEYMKQLPITLNPYTRLSIKPSPILTPLWGMTKKEVYLKLHSELTNVVVLNTYDQQISEVKMREWVQAGLMLPDYIDDIKRSSFGWLSVMNNFGLYFADSWQWYEWFKYMEQLDIGFPDDSPLFYATPSARLHNRPILPYSEIDNAVNSFKKIFTLYFKSLKQEKDNVN